MTVTVYRSTDVSAPVLTGQTSKLIDLLHACLVTGYGSKAAAGWTRAYFDDTNDTAAFRQGAGSMNYLRVDDGGPGAATFMEARVTLYETMSDVDTGTPANGTLYAWKSITADATARAWVLVATNKLFHLFIYTGYASSTAPSVLSFGDIYSYKPSDAYCCHLAARAAENVGHNGTEAIGALESTKTAVNGGHVIARSYTGIGGSVAVGQHSDYWIAGQTVPGYTGGVTYPDPVDGGMLMTPIYIHEATVIRGTLPGLWNSLHNMAFTAGDTISGVGGLSGRTFEVLLVGGGSTGQILVETSSTWTEN